VQWRLVKLISAVTWRSVESDDTAPAEDGPVLLVANHFGGAADAVVLMDVLPRRPRILADDKIWTVPVAGQMMQWLGAIPVHRGRGGEGSDNADMFAECHEALGQGEMLLIFPEGITRDEPSIGKVRSGAARIALGARSAGVRGLRIVPVGLHYDDKAAFRSSVYVRRGDVIDLDAEVDAALGGGAAPEGEHERVELLTELIDRRLREAAPDFSDWRQARALQLCAEAFLRTLEPTEAVPAGLRNRLAAWLARRADSAELVELGEGYRRGLSHAGVSDTWAAEGGRRLNLHSLWVLLGWLLMLPYALLGIVMCGVPILLTWLVSKLRLAPAVVASILPLAGALLFALTAVVWMVLGYRVDRLTGLTAAPVAFGVSFAALMLVSERAHLWLTGLHNRVFGLRHHGHRLSEQRNRMVAAVCDEVLGALGQQDPTKPSPSSSSSPSSSPSPPVSSPPVSLQSSVSARLLEPEPKRPEPGGGGAP
jgi:1-acyl-sn-glycerol-3-phosphate acyltransferase